MNNHSKSVVDVELSVLSRDGSKTEESGTSIVETSFADQPPAEESNIRTRKRLKVENSSTHQGDSGT